jgi:hypothetical protein
MQPDNARPAASSPKITFNDDMAHFQSKVWRSQANLAPETRRFH